MPSFAHKMIQDLPIPRPNYWLGAFQPHCGGSGEPSCTDTWTGWDWVDNTPNDKIDCDSFGCGKNTASG
jgi:hypothetical protein